MSEYTYSDMVRELGFDPTDPDHVEKMQESFAHDELELVGLSEEDLTLLQSLEPTEKELKEIEDEQ